MTVASPISACRLRCLGLWLLIVVVWLGGAFDRALASQSVNLTWLPSSDTNVLSYKIYYGTQSQVYPNFIVFGNVSSAVIPGLGDGQTYYFAVSAIDAQGDESPLSNEAVYQVPAATANQLRVQGTTTAMNAVAAAWTPSPDSDVYGYAVRYGTQSGVYTNTAMFYYTTNGLISGLAAGVTYYFTVSPVDYNGIEAVSSGVAAYTIPLPPALMLQAQMPANAPGVQLTWNAITNEGVTYYSVSYGTQSGVYTATLNFASTNAALIEGLNPGQTYYFVVVAWDDYGNQSKASNEAAAVAVAPPRLQLTAQATVPVSQAAALTWTPSPDSGIYAYQISYGTQSGVYNNSDIFYSRTNGVVSGLTGGVTYYFVISPVGSYGVEAVASSEISFTVPLPQGTVLQAQLPAHSPGVELKWNAITNGAVSYYNVYYGTQSGVYTNMASFDPVGDAIIEDLVPGQIYYFVITSVDNYGDESPYSNEASSVAAGPAPIQLRVQADPSALRDVNLVWTPSTDTGVYAYEIYYGTQSGVYNLAALFFNQTNSTITGLTLGTNYYFAVAAVDSQGIQPIASSEVSYATPAPGPMILKTQTSTDENGVPNYITISTPSAVSGPWEMDCSTNLHNWVFYANGNGNGNGDGYDVYVGVSLDPTVPIMYFRVVQ